MTPAPEADVSLERAYMPCEGQSLAAWAGGVVGDEGCSERFLPEPTVGLVLGCQGPSLLSAPALLCIPV